LSSASYFLSIRGLELKINIFLLTKGYHDVERIFACQRHPQILRLSLKAHAGGNLGEISAIRVAI